jgi:class 3 adenylate cyclase/tetratricopeptide (TPR) repeat protein
MEALAAYLPLDRRRALANAVELPERANGAVLFADIWGFTALTDTLVKELGPMRGTDELTRHLNTVFGALISQVHHYQGCVIGFSGDAITCWFDQDGGRQAIACGLSMQQVMEQFKTLHTPVGGTVSMAMKAAVATGQIRRFKVGDPQIQYLDVLTGPALSRAVAAEQTARKGEVVVDFETQARLANDLTLLEWRESRPDSAPDALRVAVVAALRHSEPDLAGLSEPDLAEPPAQPLSESQIRPWLLPPVYKRLRSGHGRFLAEIRRAVALFLRFTGLDYDRDEQVSPKLDAYIQWVQRTLARYGGSLIQLTTGDKGSYLYATFGAPIAHEDDAHRAVAAALELRNLPPELAFIQQVQIGLSRGWMHSGAYGGPTRRTYGVIGDEANVAARLMSQAGPNQILIAGRIAAAVTANYQLRMLGPLALKGKAEVIPVYEVLDSCPTSLPERETRRQTALIGRRHERAILTEQLEGLLQQGQGGVVIIEGEAGIGKSRLVLELIKAGQEQGLTVLSGAGRSIERQTPYRAWHDVFTAYFDLDQTAVPTSEASQRQSQRHERVRNLVQAVGPDQISRLPLLNDILNLDFPDSELTATLDPALRQQSLTTLLISLLRSWTRHRPLILVLEDAHWLDSLSWDLTVQVARSLAVSGEPMLLVLVTRPLNEKSVEARYLTALGKVSQIKQIALKTLSTYETTALATARLGLAPGTLPLPVVNLVRQRAGGNPFFAEELILALRDQGLLQIVVDETDQQSRHCLIRGDLDQAGAILPDTIQGLILERIDRLPLKHQLTLKVASVIGRTFTYPPLQYALQSHATITEAALKAQLDTLATADLTALESPVPELTYAFKHIIIQNVAYQTLVFAQRRQLHSAIAEWYEGQAGELNPVGLSPIKGQPLKRQSLYLPLLVHHFHHAEDHERERYYARLAGEQAAAQFANDEAIAYLSRALELTPATDHAAQYQLLLAREKVYDLQGKRDEQAQALAQLAGLAERLDDDQKRAEIALRRARYAEATSDYPASISAAQQALALARLSGDFGPQAEGYLAWGHALWRTGSYVGARTQLDQALKLTQGLPHIEAHILRTQGLVAWHQGHYPEAKNYFERTLSICRQRHDWPGEALALNNLGIIASQQGNYDEARLYFNQSLLICRQTGDRQVEANILNNLGIVAGYQGDYSGAKSYYERALRIKREIGDRRGEGMVLDNLGDVLRYEGDYSQATHLFKQSLLIRQETGERLGEGNVLNNLGNVAHYQGDYGQAKIYYEQSLQLRREIGDRQGEGEGLAYLALLYHHQDDNETARQLARQARQLAQTLGDQRLLGNALTHLGHALLELGEVVEAGQVYQEAFELRRDAGEMNRAMEPLAGLARVAWLRGDRSSAALRVAEIVPHLEHHSLAGCEEPLRVYLTCYQILTATQAPAGLTLLQQAYELLSERAAKLTDPSCQRSFLEDVVVHRRIRLAWQQHNQAQKVG